MRGEQYIVLDIETTGLSKHHNKITEIAAAKVRDGAIIREFQTLINPGVPIPSFIRKLTGIDDELVKDAPPIQEVLPAFLKFLGPRVMVAHNATFDHGFLDHNAWAHLSRHVDNQRICTRRLANRLLPNLPSKKLGLLCAHLDITNEQAHRALGDVRATVDIFNHFLGLLREKGIKTAQGVLRFQHRQLKDCRHPVRHSHS